MDTPPTTGPAVPAMPAAGGGSSGDAQWRTLLLNAPDATQAGTAGYAVTNITAGGNFDIDDAVAGGMTNPAGYGLSFGLLDNAGDPLTFATLSTLDIYVDFLPIDSDVDIQAHIGVSASSFATQFEGMGVRKDIATSGSLDYGRVNDAGAPSLSAKTGGNGRAHMVQTYDDGTTGNRVLSASVIKMQKTAGGVLAVYDGAPAKNYSDSAQVFIDIYLGRATGASGSANGTVLVYYLAVEEQS